MRLFDRIIPKGLRVVLQPAAKTNVIIAKNTKICSGSQVTDTVLDRFSYMGHDCFVLRAKIGPFVSIADNVRIGGHTHDMSMVSTSPVFFCGKNVMKVNFSSIPEINTEYTIIGADVWIGANVCIKSGVSIGVGAIIGMGSVVTHDVPPYEVWAGNPAKKIRDRFSIEIKEKMLASEWWTWEESKIDHYSHLFNNPEVLIDVLEKEGEIL